MVWRRVILVCLLAGVAGCGSDSATSGSDADEINQLVRQIAVDANDKDWDGYCEALSANAKAQLAEYGEPFAGRGDCAELMDKASGLEDDDDFNGKTDPDRVKVTGLSVNGDRATALVTPGGAVSFVREDGRWKMGAPGGEDKSAVAARELEVAERGFTLTGDDAISFGAVVHNPGSADAVGVEVQLKGISADGGVAVTDTVTLLGIPAGQSVNVGGAFVFTSGKKVQRVEVTAKADGGAAAGSVTLPQVSRVRLQRDEFDAVVVRAQITNTLDEALSEDAEIFAVLRDRAGKIVGGLSGNPEYDVQPGRRYAAEMTVLTGKVSSATRADVSVDGVTSPRG